MMWIISENTTEEMQLYYILSFPFQEKETLEILITLNLCKSIKFFSDFMEIH